MEEAFSTRFTLGKPTRGTVLDLPVTGLVKLYSDNTRNGKGARQFLFEMYGPFSKDGADTEDKADSKDESNTADESENEKQIHTKNVKPSYISEPVIRDLASKDEIAELEQRLNTALTSDYKQFLLSTNGLGSSWGGRILDLPLHATNDVEGTADDYYTNDLSRDLLENQLGGVHSFIEAWLNVDSATVIGHGDIDNVWLIPPGRVHQVQEAYVRHYESVAVSSGAAG